MNDNTNLNASQTTADLAKQFRALIRLGQAARQLAGPAYVEPDGEECSQRTQREAERRRVRNKAFDFAQQFWKRLVKAVDEPHAKEIMHLVMGENTGRPRTKEENAFKEHIYLYLNICGPKLSDKKLAKRIHASNPYYAEYQSGMIVVMNNEITDAAMASEDDPIIDRRWITKSLGAIEKDVRRFRDWAINENRLPKEYASRTYYPKRGA